MKRCYVCASSLTSVDEECPKCRSSIQFLQSLERVPTRRRFLFGSIKAKTKSAQFQSKHAPVREQGEPKKARRRTPAATPKPHEREDSAIGMEETVIQNRDPGPIPKPANEPRSLYYRGVAHMVDVLLCLILNAWVLKMILFITGGNLTQLVTFSLIPLLFVLLSFTALYFWLFIGLFQVSLGNLLVQKLRATK